MATGNAINANDDGLVRYDGNGTFDAVTTTQHSVQVGSTSNGLTSIPLGNSGEVLTSNGVGLDPSFQSVSSSGAITTITGNTGGPQSPTLGNFNILGSGSITVDGSLSTETVQLTGLTNHNVLVGAGTDTITKVAPTATSGIPLVSNGVASDPSFTTASVAGGGTGQVTLTNHGVLIGQGTSPVASTATGSVGQVLQSGGAGADPSYSTATYPSTSGTSGNVLTSDGTNWISSAPTSEIQHATVVLTSAQVKNLIASPITIISAITGYYFVVIHVSYVLDVVGSAFTNGQAISLRYNSTIPLNPLFNFSFMNSATDVMYISSEQTSSSLGVLPSSIQDQPITITHGGTAITGNAENNNTLTVSVSYLVRPNLI